MYFVMWHDICQSLYCCKLTGLLKKCIFCYIEHVDRAYVYCTFSFSPLVFAFNIKCILLFLQ